MNIKSYYGAGALVLVSLLAACGGGGGSGGGVTPPTVSPTGTPTLTPSLTNATGIIVDDSTGAPLAGVKVQLMPWAPCAATPSPAASITPENDGCPTPLPSPQATTNAQGQFALDGVPNGHYLLVAGNDTVSTPPPGYSLPSCTNACGSPTPAPFTVQATVHDSVTLTGGNQTLHAPTLPTLPTGYTAPSWETSGDYRLAMLDATREMPCYIAWQYERAQHGLAGSSVDEWLLEDDRANVDYLAANHGGTTNTITSQGSGITGGTSCDLWMRDQFVGGNKSTIETQAIWYAGVYDFASGFGQASFPIDPRSYTDPQYPSWP